MSDVVKLSANLSRPVADALKELAAKRGVSVTQVLRQAISNERYFQGVADRSGKVLVEEKSGRIKEVVLSSSISP